MSKKKKQQKKKGRASSKSPPFTLPIKGWILFALSIILLLSLLSFAYGHATKNWLGLVGYNLGWFFHALFGLGSFVLCGFLGWTGWRLLFGKPVNHLAAKLFFISLLIFSLCMLLCLIEHQLPAAGSFLRNLFYPALLENKLKYHLGGALVYYLYSDMPAYNMHRILGTVGVALIFSSATIASLIYLAKIHPTQLLALLNNWRPAKDSLRAEAHAVHAEEQPPPARR